MNQLSGCWVIVSMKFGQTNERMNTIPLFSFGKCRRQRTTSRRILFTTFANALSCRVIWKINSKSNFSVSFSLVNVEMNLLGNYRTLRGLRTVNPTGLPSSGSNGTGPWDQRHLKIVWDGELVSQNQGGFKSINVLSNRPWALSYYCDMMPSQEF